MKTCVRCGAMPDGEPHQCKGKPTVSMIALIPARAGSKRIPGKNTKLLGGRPLIDWTVDAARESGVFSDILVCTDDPAVMALYPALVQKRNPVADDQADYEWVKTFVMTRHGVPAADQFAILRPTSPFRTAATIRRAFDYFNRRPDVDSMRAVEPAKQHPYKMWTWKGPGYPILPLLNGWRDDGTVWHSCPTQSLPTVYVQNSSLEMGWVRTVTQLKSIAGKKVLPFLTEGDEGFTIDYPEDFLRAKQIAKTYGKSA